VLLGLLAATVRDQRLCWAEDTADEPAPAVVSE
jgi:hypothetical protein